MDQATHTIDAVDLRGLSDAEMAELNDFGNALRAEERPDDPPVPLEVRIGGIRNIPEVDEVRAWFVRDGGALVAVAEASWEPKADDNKHLIGVEVNVLPDARRRGIGTALLARLVELAETEGRTLLIGGSSDRVACGGAFAERVGATAGQHQRISRLMLDGLDRSLVDRWVDEGPMRAEGYDLVFVDGDIPDELMEGALGAFKIMNTAPRDDLNIEDWVLTAEHIRGWEKQRHAMDGQLWTLFARHRDSGKLIGFTEIGWNPNIPGIVQQMGTAVDPEHRGHALGKWLKADMLQRLLDGDYDAHEVRTGNAESNDAMLGINVALGFAPWIASTAWQLPVETARTYLATRT
jgi:GNAT superfamily N-acetyltransferase